jgi:epoxyqueuosine reductase
MTDSRTPRPTKADAANFIPDPAQMALFPEVSGNAINGLGEPQFRRPSSVYWNERPETIAHGQLQLYFYARNAVLPLVNEQRRIRQSYIDTPMPPVAATHRDRPPQEWSALIKEKAAAIGADDCGIARFDPGWVFDHQQFDAKWVIIIAVAHDYEEIKQAPSEPASAEVIRQYGRATKLAKELAGWLHQQGWETRTHTGPNAGQFVMVPAALAAGLGQLGKHGSIINRRLGASFRLAAITVDMPLMADEPDEFGVDDFCTRCRVCEKACPPDALYAEKQPVRGTLKWYVNFDKCIPFFNETAGCAICIARCPWSLPGVADNLLVKLAKRRQPTQRE